MLGRVARLRWSTGCSLRPDFAKYVKQKSMEAMHESPNVMSVL